MRHSYFATLVVLGALFLLFTLLEEVTAQGRLTDSFTDDNHALGVMAFEH